MYFSNNHIFLLVLAFFTPLGQFSGTIYRIKTVNGPAKLVKKYWLSPKVGEISQAQKRKYKYLRNRLGLLSVCLQVYIFFWYRLCILVGWQATQKCNFKYIVKKMDFFFMIFLFDTQRLEKVMLY